MRVVLNLTKRNAKVFLRDRAAVFFSFFATLIIIMLYALFLGKANVDSIKRLVQHSDNVRWLVDSWIMAGILIINTITVTLGVFGKMVSDQQDHKSSGFLVAPISRTKVVLGYLLSAVLIGIVLTVFSFILAEIYIVAFGGEFLSLTSILKVLGYIIINVFASASMVFFLASFIHSNSGFTTLSSVIGTLIGFLTGIYMPIGVLPSFIQSVVKFIPATYGTVLMRQVFVEEPVQKVFAGAPSSLQMEFNEEMGNILKIGGTEVGLLPMLCIIIGSGVLFILLSTIVLKKKKQ